MLRLAHALNSNDDVLGEVTIEGLLDGLALTGKLMELHKLVAVTMGAGSHEPTVLLFVGLLAVLQQVPVKEFRNEEDQSETQRDTELSPGLLHGLVIPHATAGPLGFCPF